MSKEMVAALSLALLIGTPAFARCACLDSVDDVKRQMEEQAALSRLPSEASRSLARQFMQQKLYGDAKQYYDLAVQQAAEESADANDRNGGREAAVQRNDSGGREAASLQRASLAARLAHALDIDKEAADFAMSRGDSSGAAALRERALAVAKSMNDNVDLAQEYSAIAALFESAGNKPKAAQYFNKLAELLSATHGRYDRQTVAAWANYRRLAGAGSAVH
ncbi:MAG TPA: hypothetical protein V6D22_00910 [Candidatus Obscuribacterales bacterium]